MTKWAVVNVNLQYEVPDDKRTDEEIKEFVENVELPDNYIEDSFEFVKVVDDTNRKIRFIPLYRGR
jgi:hypothetical protein